MNEDLIHHRLRDSHQSQTSIMNFIRKVVEIDGDILMELAKSIGSYHKVLR